VQDENQQETDLDRNNQRVRNQGVRVLVEDLRPRKYQRVAREVENKVREQREPGETYQ
jgi:hypothetical protein